VFAEVDYRQPRNARRGGWYRLDASRYQARNGPFDFTRLEADLRQYLSVFAERRVLALRLMASTSTADAGSQVPFYLMPSLGGHDSLRGFRDYRFRGPHALLAQAEYRYEIWSGFDAALFYDAGKVANSRQDLDFTRLQHDYGIGFRFNTDNGVIFRVDAGFGSRDGRHLFIVFGDVF
jgi:outer membrane translocation and assembly module TamA